MNYDPTNPLIVQGDRSILVEVDNPRYAEARDALAPFAELEKSPEHIHTYRLTRSVAVERRRRRHDRRRDGRRPAPLQQVSAADQSADGHRRTGQPLWPGQAGEAGGDKLRLVCADRPLLEELARQPKVREYLGRTARREELSRRPGLSRRAEAGADRRRLSGRGPGRLHRRAPLCRCTCASWRRSGLPFHVRDYQRDAADIFYAGGDVRGGSGVIVLPCGAGKTIVGIAAMALMQQSTLVLTTSITAVKQWHREILDKTDLHEDQSRRIHRRIQGNRARSRWRPIRSSRIGPTRRKSFRTSSSSISATGA